MTTREATPAEGVLGGGERPPPALEETKHATKTTEFWAFIGLLVALIIAGAAVDGFDAGRVWLSVTILSVAYILSRGIAKSQRGRGGGHETKDAYQTTEFWIFVAALVGLLIAGAVSDGQGVGEADTLDGNRVWLYAPILGGGYMVSRGLAKSGAGARADDRGDAGRGVPVSERVKAAAGALSGSEGGSSPQRGEEGTQARSPVP